MMMSGNCLSKLDSILDDYKHIIELLTLIGVVIALYFQNQTIRKQKEEFDRQKIKDRKTEFLSLVTMSLNEYNLFMEKQDGATDIGRRGYKQSVLDYLNFLFINFHESRYSFSELIIYGDDKEDPTRIDSAISEYIIIGPTGHHEDFLRPYFFLVENSLLLLDNYKIVENEVQDFNEKKESIRYFFSKLNDYELHLFMFYCLNERGAKMKEIIEKYSLFENRRFYSLVFDLKGEFKNSAFHSSESK